MRLKSILFFGATLFKLLAKRAFKERRGEKFLRSQFEPEGLFTISKENRALYPEFSRCINCGFCEIYLDTHRSIEKPEFIFNSLTVNLPDLRLPLAHLNEPKNFQCPAGAPLSGIIEFIKQA